MRCFWILSLFFFLSSKSQIYNVSDHFSNLHEFDQSIFGWGYFAGVNRFDFKISPNSAGMKNKDVFALDVQNSIGLHVGLIGKMRLHKYLDLLLEPGVYFVNRKIVFENASNNPMARSGGERKIRSTYLNLPLILKFNGERFHNIRPFLSAGMGYSLNLESNEKKKADNLEGIFRMKTHNFNWQAEAGVEIYLPHFKLTPSVKGLFFLNNELIKDNPGTPALWAGALQSLRTRAIVFSLKFE